MSTPQVVVHADADTLAEAVADRLVAALAESQAARGAASVVLTGGGLGIRLLSVIAASRGRDAVDWSALDVWWGDERFLPSGDPRRNETQARAALLDRVDLDPARVHPMGASDGPDGDDPEAAAARYAAELARAARPEDHAPVPSFDVLLLGLGPDGHVASLFPQQPALHEAVRTVVAVRGSPKSPPTRLSLTLPAIGRARQVWVVAAGEAKAVAVQSALAGSGVLQVPAAGARGRVRTLFLLDRAAAGRIPPQLPRIASP